jgi:molybdate transport system substrate-binding protein
MNVARAAAAVLVLALVACGADGRADSQQAAPRKVTVSVAASLAAVFTQLERAFEAAQPGVDLTVNTGASSALAEQIVRGAPVDVFAAADAVTMARVTQAGAAAGKPRLLARNVLQIAVPRGNPGDVRRLSDLAREDLLVALCAEQVPCGGAARRVLDAAGVKAKPDTFEQDATATITKVRLGEVDAALVYRTDVLASQRDVTGIDFPEAERAMNDYLIVAMKGTPAASEAEAFIDYVLSDNGQAELAAAGFRTP